MGNGWSFNRRQVLHADSGFNNFVELKKVLEYQALRHNMMFSPFMF